MTEPNGDDGAIPVVEPRDFDTREPVHQGTVAGVVLAAGTSSRFGTENKLLAPLEGEPVVRHIVRTLRSTDLSPLVVVVGHEAERVGTALEDFDVDIVVNSSYDTGQATSVRTGVDAVRDRADATLIALGDMPLVSVETIERLLDAYRAEVADILAASYEGRRGNPVIFDETFFDDLTDIDGDIGGQELLRESNRSVLVETDDPGVLRDVDRPNDLDSLTTDR